MTSVRRSPWPWVIVVALAVSLGGGAALKGACFGSHQADWRSRLCYNDIQPLYNDPGHGIRRGEFPYLHARLVGQHGVGGFNEYPVLTGTFMWAVGRASRSASSYLVLTMLALGTCAALSTFLLWRLVERRAVWFAAPPILLLYAFHNWDLLAVCAAVVGFYAWRRDRWFLAAAAFAVGAAFKLYPGLFIVALALDAVRLKGRRQAAAIAGVGLGSLVLINLPFALVGTRGWWATFRFQTDRPASTSGSVWSVLDPSMSAPAENALAAASILLGITAVTVGLARTSRHHQRYPVVQWCGASTAVLIALDKVGSPQYVLWMLPFLAMIATRASWWSALSTVATVRYGALFGVDVLPIGLHTADAVAHASVVAQTGLLLAYAARVSTTCVKSPI